MRKLALTLIFAAITAATAIADTAKVDYDTYFTSDRLRLDFILAGDAERQEAFLAGLKKECRWAGSHESLIDPFRYGEYMFEAWAGDTLIYSKGFSTLFLEWRSTPEAMHVQKAFTQTVWMPFPRREITVTLSERVKSTGEFRQLFSCAVDPDDALISPEPGTESVITPLLTSGDMSRKVDLLFVAEGYTAEEMDKFHDDCRRFMDYLFSMEPYRSRKGDFNVSALDVISEDSGTDIPHQGIWKKTALNSNFYTFYMDRYLTVSDYRSIADHLSGAPFDAFVIIANDSKYGGGGIYNSYALGTSDHKFSKEVFIHEFGHSFAGLGDEYFDSEVAFDEFYNLSVEPWEPNITTLVDFSRKWKDMIDSGEWDKESVGLHEGGGYMAKGVYRSRDNCRMRTNTAGDFCPVCRRAISRMIDYYCR
ncbi:MAG TPA: IgA Peptidase M64 [Candidatus Coprenecus stercoravium]|uniref:IgA Peptidase M64 n=1 Tax=Candidatus Coprenecus stercoravium TaxID=2840735 RepID=A0A9D2GQ53_9BACT|nr:IgA Peptidase M64 [Candidatus Coprenecus stercoravium]